MVEFKQNYAEYNMLDDKAKSKVAFNDIFVEIEKTIFGKTEKTTVPLKDLFVNKQTKGKDEFIPLKSMRDYDNNILNGDIYFKEKATGKFAKVATATLMYKPVLVPEVHKSTALNITGATEAEKVAFGLKRDLKVKQVSNGEYIYSQIDGEWTFVNKSNIYWYEGTTQKTYDDFKTLSDTQKKNIKLFDDKKREITSVYTEFEYDFEKVLAKEEVDLEKGKKKTYSQSEDGTYSYSTNKLSMTISSQTFEKQVIDDKEVSVVKTINYQATKNGEFIAISVNNQIKMVTFNDITDEDGNFFTSFEDLKNLVGERVCVKEGNSIVATSEPLTFEQANLTYDSVKTYQRVQGEATEETCLRLEDGEYVKELETVQPISYKVSNAGRYDKYLIKQAGENGRFVVVDIDYFEKNGKNAEFDTSKILKLQRCDFKDKDCSIVQSTSSNQEIENCDAVRDVIVDGVKVHKQTKDVAYESFLESYKAGNYQLNDFYVNTLLRSVQKNSGRYEYTDTAYYEDKANNLHQYQSVNTSDLTLKDGKIEGGAKIDFKKALKKAYSRWGIATFAAVSVVPFAGVFVTALASLVSVYGIGCAVACPIIPGIVAIASREKTKYKDKTQYNRKKLAKEVKKELNALYERTDLTEMQFEDTYSRIMNKIVSLSQTTSNNSLTLVDGTATVNSNNINLAHKYKKDINKCAKLIEKNDKSVKDAQEKYDALSAKAGKYVNAVVPARLQSKLDKAKKELDELLEEQKELKNRHDSLSTTTAGENYNASPKFNVLQRKAQALKLMKYVKEYHYSYILSTMSDELKNKLHLNRSKDNIMIDDVSIFSDDEVVEKQSDEWKTLREEALQVLDGMNKIQPLKPTNGNVQEEISRIQSANELKEQVEEFIKAIDVVKDDIHSKVEETNRDALLEKLEKIKKGLSSDNLEDLEAKDIEKLKDVLKEKNENLDNLNKQVAIIIENQKKDKKKEEEKEKSFDTKMNSEDSLVELLKANPKSKDRIKLIEYIKAKSGVDIAEHDILLVIDRINEKHLEGKNASDYASRLKNKNIDLILSYGQQYLTWYAEEIKKRTAEHSS